MMRPLYAPLLGFLLSWPVVLQAEERVDAAIVSRIEADGYVIVEVKRTWLGRILITAENGENLREVVIHRKSDEVLRDRVFALDANAKENAGKVPSAPTVLPLPGPGQIPTPGPGAHPADPIPDRPDDRERSERPERNRDGGDRHSR